jgi:hypothetical protein
MATMFETETCGRCGGTGKYSYNQIDGDRCFGCSGSGRRLTKRGFAARAFYQTLGQKPIEQVQPGEVVWFDSIFTGSGWLPVATVEDRMAEYGHIALEANLPAGSAYKTVGYCARPGTLVRFKGSPEEMAERKEKALHFQSTLTKAGKPAKRS